MKSPKEPGMGAPEQKAPAATKESVTAVEKLFDKAKNEFIENQPDFKKIKECISYIQRKLRNYRANVAALLCEDVSCGGGCEDNKHRIT